MTEICPRCEGEGEIDYPELYRRSGPPEDCDPPGAWMDKCPNCDGTGEVADDVVSMDDWYDYQGED